VPDQIIDTNPQSEVEVAGVRVPTELRKRLASSLHNAYDQALSDRSGIDSMIRTAESNYEMSVGPKTFPWPNSSNCFIPLVPEQVDSVVDNTKKAVFVPSFFLVLPNTGPAQMSSHKVQRYYNSQLTARRANMQMWKQECDDYLHLAALHGTSYLDVTYMQKTAMRRYAVLDTEMDENGIEVLHPETGQPIVTSNVHEVEVEEYNDVVWEALELREVVLIPARAQSTYEADTIVRIMYLTENKLYSMVEQPAKDGKPRRPGLWKDVVDKVVRSVAVGTTERPNDMRGTETWSIGGAVNPNSPSGTDGVDGRLRTTEFEILRFQSKAYALTPNGPLEHMIFYLHRETEELLGAWRFPYHHNRPTTVSLSLLRRPKRAYGYGVPERLRTLQSEVNANNNQRRDQINLRLSPPRRQDPGVKILGGEDGEWGPHIRIIGPKDSYEILAVPDILVSSERDEDRLYAMAGRIMGQSPISVGVMPNKKTDKVEAEAAAAGQSARQGGMSANVQYSMMEVFWLTHELKKQYLPQQISFTTQDQGKPERLSLTKDELEQDYSLLVAGMGGSQDKAGERDQVMLLHQMFTARPDIQASPDHLYAFDRLVLENFDRPDIETLIGSPADAQKRMQALQQQQAMMEAQKHGTAPPGGGGQPPPGGAPPQGMVGPPGLGGGSG
jgi:hypothetical protein